MARSNSINGGSVAALLTIATLARKSIRDARTLERLLVEAGEFKPELLVNSLVKSRTIDITEIVRRDVYPPTAQLHAGKYNLIEDMADNGSDDDKRAAEAYKSALAALEDDGPAVLPLHHDNVVEDWRFDGDIGIQFDDDEFARSFSMNGTH